MATAISFDSNDLQTANIQTSDILHEQIPNKDAALHKLAHASGSKIPFVSYSDKTIRIKGKVIDSNVVSLDSRLDTFRSYFLGQDKNLDIGYNSTTRRYICTATGLVIDRPGGLGYANFEIELAATQPFGQNTATTSALSGTGRTSGTYTDSHTFLGTAPFQKPIVTIGITAVTGGTSATLSFGNNGTGQQISITRTFVAGDSVVIDSLLRSVKVNGVDAVFTGAFPEFAPGSGSMIYNDTFTTRTFTINAIYYPMYL